MRRTIIGWILAVAGGVMLGWLLDHAAHAQGAAGTGQTADVVVLRPGPPGETPAQGANAGAQSFEVASVKQNKSGEGFVAFRIQPGGRFTATNVPLRELIRAAYQVQNFQIVGAPRWGESERFDIVAKAENDFPQGPPTGAPGPLQYMLQSLLAERFKLKAHRETREMPVYELVMARSDGRTGPKLVPSSTDCAAVAAARRGGGPPGPPALAPGQRMQCGMRIGPGTISAGGMSLAMFANGIAPMVGRVILDRTGLTGNFDIDLEWTPDRMPQGGPPPGGPDLPPIDPNGPSIFTAVQEQLGLRLESTRGPVDVLVVDSVEPPTPD
jgi:uncharacterized protein (TIGR03435 family)